MHKKNREKDLVFSKYVQLTYTLHIYIFYMYMYINSNGCVLLVLLKSRRLKEKKNYFLGKYSNQTILTVQIKKFLLIFFFQKVRYRVFFYNVQFTLYIYYKQKIITFFFFFDHGTYTEHFVMTQKDLNR